MRFFPSKKRGFTLAELLIALGILGVIATFTIPKVLSGQQSSKNNAIAKEMAATLSAAYQEKKYSASITATTISRDFTPFMNYVRVDTVSSIDAMQTSPVDMDCFNPAYECLVLHSGAKVLYHVNVPFCGTGNNALYFYLDPDGVSGSPPSGGGNSVVFFLYANGSVRTYGSLNTGTQNGPACVNTINPIPTFDPPWFVW